MSRRTFGGGNFLRYIFLLPFSLSSCSLLFPFCSLASLYASCLTVMYARIRALEWNCSRSEKCFWWGVQFFRRWKKLPNVASNSEINSSHSSHSHPAKCPCMILLHYIFVGKMRLAKHNFQSFDILYNWKF